MSLRLKAINILFLTLFCSWNALAVTDERVFTIINAANGLADNSAHVIVCTKTGRMIISTDGHLNFYDGSSFNHITTQQKYRYPLPSYQGDYRLCFDEYHHIWLKYKGSVTCVDLLIEKFSEDVEGEIKKLGCNENVTDLYTDNSGNLWFLTSQGLYDVEHKKYFQVQRGRVLQEVDVYQDILLTFYDNGEVCAINRESGNILRSSKAYDWEEASKYELTTLIHAYQDSYFVIKKGEEGSVLLKLDVNTLQWKRILDVPYHLNNMAVHEHYLYVASSYGYWIYDIRNGQTEHVDRLKLDEGRYLEIECNTITADKQGGLWIGTNKRGVLYARPQTSPFHVYTLDQPQAIEMVAKMEHIHQNISEFNGKQANCMFEDSRKYSWFGTTTGLYMFREPKSEPIVFDKKNGLLNNVIHSIVEDKDHNIWISTSRGISCIIFDKNNPVFVNTFYSIDNVPEEAFVNSKAMCLEDSTIIMQSIDHLVEFNPNRLKLANEPKTFALYPKLIKILVNGDFVAVGEEKDGVVIINRAITRVKEVNLSAEQKSVSLTFSALNYYRPLQTYYRVRVKGMDDDDWHIYSYYNSMGMVDSRGMLHLPLVSLEPGNYEIDVQASMFPDMWEGIVPYVWIVHVNQPWWQATRAYMLIILVIIILLVVNFILYNLNTRMRARRNSGESDIVKKINAFTQKCDNFRNDTIAPTLDDLFAIDIESSGRPSPEFVTLMVKLIPFIHECKGKFTMKELSQAGNMEVKELYNIMTANLFKSPREVAFVFILDKAAHLLKTTDKTIEEIADECNFYTPNYFIGCFFHKFKMTPHEYRKEKAML